MMNYAYIQNNRFVVVVVIYKNTVQITKYAIQHNI